jgi:septum formation protein
VLTLKIANAKADALLSKVSEPSILITSDQVIVCNGVIREKPESVGTKSFVSILIHTDQCKEFLRSYSQYPAEAYSSVVMVNTKTGKRVSGKT